MLISPINFAGIDPISFKDDMFSGLLRMRQAQNSAEDRSLKNEGIGYENSIQGAKAQYAPENERYNAMESRAKGENAQQMQAAKLAEILAHAHHLRKTADNAGYDPLLQGEGVEGSLYKLPKNAQVDIIKDMRGDVRKMDELLLVNKELNQFREIGKKFPKMNESLQALLLNGGENPGIIAQLAKKLSLNPKEYEALTQAQKIANSVALRMASTMGGGKRWTDYMAKMVQSIKPSPLHPSPTNDMIIDNILKENSFAKGHREKLLEGLKRGFAVWPDYEGGRKHPEEKGMADALTQNAPSQNGSDPRTMVKIRFNGVVRSVPASDANSAIQAGGELVQ